MADIREQILSRLVTVCAGVTGIVAVVRNQLDVPPVGGTTPRPAIIVQDGTETKSGIAGQSLQRHKFDARRPYMMEVHPVIELKLRADAGSEAGSLISLFRGRILNAVIGDAALQSYVGANGDIWLESFSQPDPLPESKEPRANFEFVFLYPLRRGDLAA